MTITPWISKAPERSFISPQLRNGWASQNDQSKWAEYCNDALSEVTNDILRIRNGEIPFPQNITHALSVKTAAERFKIAQALNQAPEFGRWRNESEDIYTILSPVGTFGTQFEEVKKRILDLSRLENKTAAPGLAWKTDQKNIDGLQITTVHLEDAEGKVMQVLQTLQVIEPGKTLRDYSDVLNAKEYPQWHEALTTSNIAEETGRQTQAAFILHTPAKNLDSMWHHADEAIGHLIRADEDPETLRKRIAEVTWVLGLAPSVVRGGASTTDILVKSLMKANIWQSRLIVAEG